MEPPYLHHYSLDPHLESPTEPTLLSFVNSPTHFTMAFNFWRANLSLRFRAGKEQTLKAFKRVFPIYALMRKNPYACEKIVKFAREYDT